VFLRLANRWALVREGLGGIRPAASRRKLLSDSLPDHGRRPGASVYQKACAVGARKFVTPGRRLGRFKTGPKLATVTHETACGGIIHRRLRRVAWSAHRAAGE
jgi:hypothetical protein